MIIAPTCPNPSTGLPKIIGTTFTCCCGVERKNFDLPTKPGDFCKVKCKNSQCNGVHKLTKVLVGDIEIKHELKTVFVADIEEGDPIIVKK